MMSHFVLSKSLDNVLLFQCRKLVFDSAAVGAFGCSVVDVVLAPVLDMVEDEGFKIILLFRG